MQDTQKTADKSHCKNCDAYLPVHHNYCSNCGQRDRDAKVSFWNLFRDVIEAVFSFDSKMLRTLRGLFVPGRLTVAYFRGQQQRYYRPFRLFFVLAVIHFALIGLVGFDSLRELIKKGVLNQSEQAFRHKFVEEADSLKSVVLAQHEGIPEVSAALDTLTNRLDVSSGQEKSYFVPFEAGQLNGSILAGLVEADEVPERGIPISDMLALTPKEVIQKHKVEGFWEQLQVAQASKVLSEGASVPEYLLGKLVWTVLLTIVASGLVLKLLYLRRRRFLVEHLIFALHYHAFAFLLMSLAMLLTVANDYLRWIPELHSPIPLAFTGLVIYLYVAMRRVYGQGWGKTFVKYTIFNFAYLFVFILAITLTLVASLLIY